MQGWIKLHRQLLDWEWYTDQKVCRLFIHLLLKANHKPQSWQGYDIMTGQVITGRKQLSAETGLSVQEIRTSINKLKSTSEITTESTSKFTIVTLCNWATYQIEENTYNKQNNQHSNQRPTSNQPAINQQSTTNKNVKNNKNEKKEKNRVIDFPENLNTPEFISSWEDWTQFRKEIKKKLTPTTIEHQIKRLSEYSVDVAIKTIENSIQNGWMGLFPESNSTPQEKPKKKLTNEERIHKQQLRKIEKAKENYIGFLKTANLEQLQANEYLHFYLTSPSFFEWAKGINPEVEQVCLNPK